MKIPKKIDNNLKDTIVQVVFEPNSPPEFILGLFNNTFLNDFKYIRGEVDQNQIDKLLLQKVQLGYFVNKEETFKINVSENSITFNCLNDYIGWDNFFPIIRDVLTKLSKIDLIKKVTRLGMRYISEFENISIYENINMKISMSTDFNNDLSNSSFKTQFFKNNFLTILNLYNKVITNSNGPTYSIVDIDVVKNYNKIDYSDNILKDIDDAHNELKTTFFSLLNDKFLNSLNPQY